MFFVLIYQSFGFPDTYEDMDESKLKARLKKVEVQLREADREKLDTFRQLLEKERLEVAQLKSQLTAGYEKQTIQQKGLAAQESNQATQLKLNEELNARDEIYEKRINKVIDTFNRQLKNSGEAYKKELQLRAEEDIKKFEHFEEMHRKQLNGLQLRVEEFKGEKVKELEDSIESHKKELINLKVKIEEIKIDEAKILEDIEIAHRNEVHNLQVKVEELKKKLKESEEAQRKEIYNVTLMVKREEPIKKLKELFNQQKMLTETLKKEIEKLKKEIEKLKKENDELTRQVTQINKLLTSKEDVISKLKDHEKSCSKEIQGRLEVFDKKIKELQLEIDHYLKLQLPPKNIPEVKRDDVTPTTEHKTREKKSEGQIKQNSKKNKQDKGSCCSKMVEETAKELFTKNVSILFSDGSVSSEPLNPDVLALMKKTKTYQHPALSYDVETATINIYCSDLTQREKIKEKLFTAYKDLLMSNKLKEYALSIDNVQDENAIMVVKKCTATFSHTYFRYDSEKKEIKCLSTDAEEIQNVKTVLGLMKENCESTLNFSYSHAQMQKHGRINFSPSGPQLHPSETPAQLSTYYRKKTGNQPLGGIMVTTVKQLKLPGHEKYSTIQINYQISSGKQGKEHPNPGQPYHGTSQTAYVPNSPVGREVVKLLRKAFDARMIFTVGPSQIMVSGATDVVVWGDILHKTNTRGGPSKSVTATVWYVASQLLFLFHYSCGYPDPTYLRRVLDQLAAKGITE